MRMSAMQAHGQGEFDAFNKTFPYQLNHKNNQQDCQLLFKAKYCSQLVGITSVCSNKVAPFSK